MTLVVPSAINFKMRFPAFADASDAVIEFAIEEACRHVDDSWMSGDQVLGISYMAAHLIVMAEQAADNDGRETISEHIGPLSETYATGGVPKEVLEKTTYGQQFLVYRGRNAQSGLVV